jgi:hypothetical protein
VILKATSKQLLRDDITFEKLKEVFQELGIDSQYKLRIAKQENKIKIPGYYEFEKICQQKTGKKFDDYFEFKRSVTKPRQIDRITNPEFIARLKSWCLDNNIKSQPEFASAKGKPKEFPSINTIVANYGHDYFSDVIGLARYKHTTEDKLIDDEFNNKLKEWCIKNDITSINKYNNADKPKEFPSAERIRQILGNDYFKEILDINVRDYSFLSKDEARKVCIANGILTSNSYPRFYQFYNEKNEVKLPSDPYRHYQTNWSNFIQLSDTQLFIGNSMSNLELFTYKLFFDRNIDFEIEKTFEDCRSKNPLPFDFYLPSVATKPVIVELDGEHHRNIDEKSRYYSKTIKKHDEIKNKYCSENNIQLIRINHIVDIEPVLNKEINLEKYPKIQDLDWTTDFNTEDEIINSKLSKSMKVKLLLLMAEKGKCNLSNVEIISKINIRKPHFYGIKNELISLKLIDRPNEYYFTEIEMENIGNLYKQGKSISEIVRETGYSNRAYLIKRLKEMGIDYQTSKVSSEQAIETTSKILDLYQKGFTASDIARKLKISNAAASLRIREYKIKIGELKITDKVIETANYVRQQQKNGLTLTDIAKELGCSKQHLFLCVKQTKSTQFDKTFSTDKNASR